MSIAEVVEGELKSRLRKVADEGDEAKRKGMVDDLVAGGVKNLADELYSQGKKDSSTQVILKELSQSDLYTRRARPTVVYAGLLFIFAVHVLYPILFLLIHPDAKAVVEINLPEGFWWAWSGVTSVWAVGRTYEKVNGVSKLSSPVTGSKPANG